MEIVVPWRFLEEWKAVGELIYSEDVQKLKKAYEVLRSWKSRCLKLPAGVECTIIILEAFLVEDEMEGVPELERESILASCYAMALTRFLNLASSFEKERTYFSLYRIARNLNLPEWIVNLRHQSSHGLELPSLVVLKAGLTLALDWLDKEYWKIGPAWRNLESSSSSLEECRRRFTSLVVSYQDLMKLKICTSDHLRKEDRCSLESIMKAFVSPRDDDWVIESGSNEETVEEVPNSVNECLAIIISKSLAVLKTVEKRCLDVGLLLQDFLLNSLFLPVEDEFNLYSDDLDRNVLPREMIVIWRTFLQEVILKAGLLPSFMRKLIDFKSRQEMPQRCASIWVKSLASFLHGAQVSKRTLERQKKKTRRQPAKKEDTVSKKKEGKDSQWTMNFAVDFLPGKAELNSLIEDVICNPRRSTLVYIRELLKLYDEPFSDQKTDMIVKAIEIQLQTNEDYDLMEVTDSSVRVGDIEEFCGNMLLGSNPASDGVRKKSGSECFESSKVWENLPLGVYPGYYEHIKAQGPMLELGDDVMYLCE